MKVTMAKKLSWDEALQRLLRGESVNATRISEGGVCYLRHRAWAHGYCLQDSGIFGYRTYSFTKAA